VWVAGYELDVIARRGTRLVFCEVKSKSGMRFGDPLEMITAEKVRRIRRAAEVWMATHREHERCRIAFDVIVERAGKLDRLGEAF
jgi:putative endonuclease